MPTKSIPFSFRILYGRAGLCARSSHTTLYPFRFSSCFFKSKGISLVSLATGTPAASKAAIFSEAVPEPLEMMAPACPICLPGGA